MMRIISAIIALIFFSSVTFAQKKESSDSTQKKIQNNAADNQNTGKKKQDSTEVHITPEASGVKRSIGYKFSSQQQDSDPGGGMFRYNNASINGVTYIIVDDNDISGGDQTNWYSTWDKETGATGRGRVTIADDDGKVITVFDFTGVFIKGNGFWKLPVKFVSGAMPAEGSVYYYVFERISHHDTSAETSQTTTVSQPEAAAIAAETVVVAQASNEAPVVQTEQINPPVDTVRTVQNNVVAAAVVATETAVVAQVNNEPPVVQVEQITPPVDTVRTVQNNVVAAAAVVAETAVVSQVVYEAPVIQTKQQDTAIDSINVAQKNGEGKVIAATGIVAASQANAGTATVSGNRRAPATQTTQSDQPGRVQQTEPTNQAITQTTQANRREQTSVTTQTTQTKPLAQTTQSTQSKPVTQTTQTTQSTQTKPITQTTQTTQTKPITQTTQSAQTSQYGVSQSSYQSQSGVRRKLYHGIIEVGYGLGLGDYGQNNFKFNFINGFRIGKYSTLGLGIGYRHLFNKNESVPYLVSGKDQIPVFLDFRTTFTSKKLTPYLAVGFGGSSSYRNTESRQEGLLFNTSGGIWYNLSEKFAVFAGIVYELQKLEFSDTNPFADNYTRNAHSLGINIGISF